MKHGHVATSEIRSNSKGSILCITGVMQEVDGKEHSRSRARESEPNREHLNRGAKEKIPICSLLLAATHHILVESEN